MSFFDIFKSESSKVEIENLKTQTLKSKDIKVKSQNLYNIDTNSIQGENAIILTYKDNKGISYEESVVGYLEKGYSGKSNVFINEIDNNGNLGIEVK